MSQTNGTDFGREVPQPQTNDYWEGMPNGEGRKSRRTAREAMELCFLRICSARQPRTSAVSPEKGRRRWV
jgi:hypothetical protein